MHNPFAKPHTLGQWLLGSVCWVVLCLAGFCGVVYTAVNLFSHNAPLGIWAIFGIAGFICVVMLRQVILIGWHLLLIPHRSWLKLLMGVWLSLLTLSLIASVILIPMGLLISLAFASDS